jgi:hypothetical protein
VKKDSAESHRLSVFAPSLFIPTWLNNKATHLNVLKVEVGSTLGSSRLYTSIKAHYLVQFGRPHFRVR